MSLKQFLVISLEVEYKTYRSHTKSHKSLDVQELLFPVWKLEVISEYQKGSSYIEEIPAAEQPLLPKDQSEHVEDESAQACGFSLDV